jgi:hypothetical protein
VFAAGEANGDAVVDFTGNGALAGDIFRFVRFGTAAEGATFSQIGATQWQIHSGLDGHNEVITLLNGASVDMSDYVFQDATGNSALVARAAGDFNGDSLAERQRLAGNLDYEWHHDHRWGQPALCWPHLACRCGGRFQRRRQVRYSLAERQRLAGNLDDGWHHDHRWSQPTQPWQRLALGLESYRRLSPSLLPSVRSWAFARS